MNDTTSPTTASNTVTVEYTDGSPLAPDDPRGAMARAVQAARAVTDRLDASSVHAPSPCDGWTALDLGNHLVGVLDRVAVLPGGGDLLTVPDPDHTDPGAVSEALAASAGAVHAAWTDDAVLGQEITVPWGTFPGAAVIGMFASELLVHAWDLAAALGIEVNWPEDDARIALTMARLSIPADARADVEMPFAEVVPTTDDHSPTEQLVAWMGRDPEAWRPSSS